MKYHIEYLDKGNPSGDWIDISDHPFLPQPQSIVPGTDNKTRAVKHALRFTEQYYVTLRIIIETEVEWDGDPADEDTEATDWEYETYAVYVNGAEYFPNPSPVIVEVLGGVATVESAPEWLDVEIQDYDNEPEEIGEDE